MVGRILKLTFSGAFLLSISWNMVAQNTVGTTFIAESAESGYCLFSPNGSQTTHLIDRCGQVIQSWHSEGRPGLSAYLLDNGDLLRTRKHLTGQFVGGGIGGMIERFSWEGNLIWSDTLASDSLHFHHDIAPMPNGHILAIAWEKHTGAEAISRGRLPELTPEEVWVTRIFELAPWDEGGSEVVWSWTPWDHLIQNSDPSLPHFGEPADFPGRFDVNFAAVAEVSGPGLGQDAAFDWLHVNSIDYHPERDEIILSSRNWDEIWVIDHSTTENEAGGSSGGQYGQGGDLIWRWGNPATYGRGAVTDQVFFGQHDARFTDLVEGLGVTVFNNGAGRPEGPFSTVHHIPFPLDNDGKFVPFPTSLPCAPPAPSWTYPSAPDWAFFSNNVSGYEFLESGHRLICQGADGRFFELDENEEIVWEYINPETSNGVLTQGDNPSQNSVFRATHIPLSHPALANQNLDPGPPLELNPNLEACEVNDVLEPNNQSGKSWQVYPNPTSDGFAIEWTGTSSSRWRLELFDAFGTFVHSETFSDQTRIASDIWSPGLYVGILQPIESVSSDHSSTFRLIVQ